MGLHYELCSIGVTLGIALGYIENCCYWSTLGIVSWIALGIVSYWIAIEVFIIGCHKIAYY